MRPHGTYAAYWHGCRCDRCREYQRARVARNRAERLETGRLEHGTRSAYDAGCRCDACREARARAARDVDRETDAFRRVTRR